MHNFVTDLTARGGKVLFVGTKKQAQEVVARKQAAAVSSTSTGAGSAARSPTSSRSASAFALLKDLQKQSAGGDFELLPNQEAATKEKDLERLERTLGGMRDMVQLPGALFIIDPKREHLAIHEAKRLHIPIIAITDTNCDPDSIDFVIAANDDAIRSVRLISAGIADAAIQGRMRAEATSADRELNMQAPDEVIESPMVTERDFIPEVAATPAPAVAATPESEVEPTAAATEDAK